MLSPSFWNNHTARLIALSIFGISTLPATNANANGRYPSATQLAFDPADSAHVVLRSTFGLVQREQANGPWTWVCEEAVGYTGAFDPSFVIPPSGNLFVGVPTGLSRSSDRGCSWQLVPGPLQNRFVIDLAAAKNDPKHVVAITAAVNADGQSATPIVAESVDGAETWSVLATLPGDYAPTTIDIAPSDSSRLYVAGKKDSGRIGAFYSSNDGGRTWTARAEFDMKAGKAPYVSAVAPDRPDRFYIRFQGAETDRLGVSDDSGNTFHDILEQQGSLLGFALSQDGTQIAIGGPDSGLWTASTAKHEFTKVSSISVYCLFWSGDDLYACANQASNGFALGVSHDGGHSFTPVFSLPEVTPRSCAASSTALNTCPDLWPPIASALGSDAGYPDAPLALRPDGGTAAPDASGPHPTEPVDAGYGASPGGGATLSGGCATSWNAKLGTWSWGSLLAFAGAAMVAFLRLKKRR